jgi:putative membrane protein
VPLKRLVLLGAALAVFAAVWSGPLPDLSHHSFASHMTMHIAVVAIAAPLLALAVAGTRGDPVARWETSLAMPRFFAPIPASMIELVIVWAWHLPVLHHLARQQVGAFVLEQGSFAVAGTMLWIAVAGGSREQRRLRAGEGTAALLLTSMHMTLLGALFAVAPRPLFHHDGMSDVSRIADQHLGGVIMLLVGGTSYLAGGLLLMASALRPAAARSVEGRHSLS